jgi:hypothetical protein
MTKTTLQKSKKKHVNILNHLASSCVLTLPRPHLGINPPEQLTAHINVQKWTHSSFVPISDLYMILTIKTCNHSTY